MTCQSCRQLKDFCRLPHPSLAALHSLREVSLTLDTAAAWDGSLHAVEIQYLANLPALTFLELSGIRRWADLQPLRRLPLQQLRLYRSELAEVNLLAPGALTALTELRIFTRVAESLEDLQQMMLPYSLAGFRAGGVFDNVCTNILSLPNLRRLAVVGPLFTMGLQERLQPFLRSGDFVHCKAGLNEKEKAMIDHKHDAIPVESDAVVLVMAT